MTTMMSIQRKIRSTALGAAAAVALVEVTTHLPSEGRSSLTYHYLFDHIITPLGRRLFDPEGAHHLALDVVRYGLAPRLSREGASDEIRLNTRVDIGNSNRRRLQFPGPIGLAAGFDKNGTAIPGLFDLGFSYVEIGSVTPLPQPGNARPRSFRLLEDRGVINRFGFNSEGVDRVKDHLREYRTKYGGRCNEPLVSSNDEYDSQMDNNRKSDNYLLLAIGWAWSRLMTTKSRTGVLGVNLGKNKASMDEVGVSCLFCSIQPQLHHLFKSDILKFINLHPKDYLVGIRELGPSADYLVINVSSPNTPGLRSLQQRELLHNLLSHTLKARDTYAPHAPLLVKLAPDLSSDEMEDVAHGIMDTGVDGMIVSNTTNVRPESLISKHRIETGGLSGAPIKDRSTECIRTMYKLTEGKVPIIGVGGVGSGRDAYDKLKAGASLVQVYSMMVYEGPGLVSRIRKELADIILENGYKSVEDVVGAEHEDIYWNLREEAARRKMQERETNEKKIVDL